MRNRVLITGADGFIGSHLTELLLEQGYFVRALSLYNSFSSWGWLEKISSSDRLQIVSGDIRDLNFCIEISKDIDIIFNLAALIAIPYSYIAPESYVDTNVKGTLNICQAAKINGILKLIHTSTSEVYGTAQYVPIDERHPKQPQSPYSASKIGADAIVMSFYNSFDLQVTIARPFNTYGPRQSARAIIPTIITQIAAGEKQIRLGDLTPTRDLNYVKDTCRGLLSIGESSKTTGKEINICSNIEISMFDLFQLIKELMSSDVELVKEEKRIRPKKSEVFRLWGDNSLINELTGFRPKYSIIDGLNETIKWYTDERNLENFKPKEYNL